MENNRNNMLIWWLQSIYYTYLHPKEVHSNAKYEVDWSISSSDNGYNLGFFRFAFIWSLSGQICTTVVPNLINPENSSHECIHKI